MASFDFSAFEAAAELSDGAASNEEDDSQLLTCTFSE
jgi:hypothetical protein